MRAHFVLPFVFPLHQPPFAARAFGGMGVILTANAVPGKLILSASCQGRPGATTFPRLPWPASAAALMESRMDRLDF
jgi:hypothetical protein